MDEYISFGENTVVFNYNKADLPAETPVEYELIKIKRDIIAALKASDPERYSDYNDDSDIYLSDYQNIRVLNIDGSEGWSSYGKQIEKIDYLEYMINLEELTVEFGYLRELDLSNNTKLKKLNCSHNALFGIDLSKNTELEELDCSYNGLLELDFSSNKKLKKVNCSNNWIDNIAVIL
ncbi:MAG: hypothetical protein MRZ66_09150 [Clostridiales bacterium]|nr:hypothetical protein [Clostridiales bacterium]